MGKYFGTDGFRGEANINLTVEHAYKVGRYIGWYFNQKSSSRAKIVIGKDTRRSSYMFENALVAGLTAFWSRCIYALCNNDTKCGLCRKNRNSLTAGS